MSRDWSKYNKVKVGYAKSCRAHAGWVGYGLVFEQSGKEFKKWMN